MCKIQEIEDQCRGEKGSGLFLWRRKRVRSLFGMNPRWEKLAERNQTPLHACSIHEADDPGERMGCQPTACGFCRGPRTMEIEFSLVDLQFNCSTSPRVGSRHTVRRLCDSSVFICVHLWSTLRFHSPQCGTASRGFVAKQQEIHGDKFNFQRTSASQ